MAWSLAPALRTLRDQINTTWPDRNKISDGTIGDAAHRLRKSDHNPDADGIVRATDITHDPSSGADMKPFTDALRKSADPRIKYVIYNKRLFSSYWQNGIRPFTWRTYYGSNPHTTHAHISIHGGNLRYDDSLWIPNYLGEPMPTDQAMIDFFTRFQQALIDAGYPLPRYGADGVPGDETFGAFTAALTDAGLIGQHDHDVLDHTHPIAPHTHTVLSPVAWDVQTSGPQ